ncbi:MAG: DUF305 domain-containing protein [Snowella sp.]|nr:DUF305 domain-containing protein [Snowella sp.]
MNTKIPVYGFIGLLLSAAIAGGLSFSSNAQTQISQWSPSPNSLMPHQRGMMGNMDAHFIEMMIPHHQGAIDMAKMALDRSQRSEIKTLARSIIEAQQREIDQMQSWYQQWYGLPVPDFSTTNWGMMGMNHHGMDRAIHLDTLEKAEDFDREFLREMISHHQMGVMMSTMVIRGGNQPELRNLANSIIQSQTQEINQMSQWYQNWYGYAWR